MKYTLNILKYILITILILLTITFVSVFIQTIINPDKVPSIFGYKPFIVLSGSIESELYKGDLAIVKNVNVNTLKRNDIVAFKDQEKYIVTNRIIEVVNNNGKKELITKGENNNEDSSTVKLDQVEGIYINKLSGFGNVILEMQKPLTLGIVLLIVISIGTIWILCSKNNLSIEERKIN